MVTKVRFRVVRVPGDGNCFYHAVISAMRAKGINGKCPATMLSLRSLVAKYIERSDKSNAGQRAALRAARTGVWAENEEVGATAAVLGLRIKVWEGVNGMWVTFGEPMGAASPPQSSSRSRR